MSTKRKLEVLDDDAHKGSAAAAAAAAATDGAAPGAEEAAPSGDAEQPAKRRKLSKNDAGPKNWASAGFAFGDFSFGNADGGAAPGFTGLGFGSGGGFGSASGSGSGAFGFGNGASGFGQGFGSAAADADKAGKDKAKDGDKPAAQWNPGSTDNKAMAFGDVKFDFGSNSTETFSSGFGSFNSGFSGFGGNSGKASADGPGKENANELNSSSNFAPSAAKCEMTGVVDRGDSNDFTHFETRAKIYKLKNGAYKEKGIGELKVNSVKRLNADAIKDTEDSTQNGTDNDNGKGDKTQAKSQSSSKADSKDKGKDKDKGQDSGVIDSARLLCRRDQTLKLILHEFIQKDTKFEIENKKFLRVAFVSRKGDCVSDDEEDEEEEKAKEKEKEKGKDDGEFVVNTYLIKPADASKLEDLKDAIEILQDMLNESAQTDNDRKTGNSARKNDGGKEEIA